MREGMADKTNANESIPGPPTTEPIASGSPGPVAAQTPPTVPPAATTSPPAKVAAQTKAPDRPASAAAAATPVAPRHTEQQRAAQEATAKAKLLRESLFGSKLMNNSASSDLEKVADNSSSNSGLLAGKGEGVQATKVGGGVEVKSGGAVAGIGGGSGNGGLGEAGVGYGSGNRNGVWVGGNGGSFLNIGGGGAAVDEGLTKEEVARVIQAHMSEIRYCHDASQLKDPMLAGKIMLHFAVGPDGRVKSAKEESSTITEKNLSPCILSRLVKWQFPKPRGGVTVKVSFPFLFKTLDK